MLLWLSRFNPSCYFTSYLCLCMLLIDIDLESSQSFDADEDEDWEVSCHWLQYQRYPNFFMSVCLHTGWIVGAWLN